MYSGIYEYLQPSVDPNGCIDSIDMYLHYISIIFFFFLFFVGGSVLPEQKGNRKQKALYFLVFNLPDHIATVKW